MSGEEHEQGCQVGLESRGRFEIKKAVTEQFGLSPFLQRKRKSREIHCPDHESKHTQRDDGHLKALGTTVFLTMK